MSALPRRAHIQSGLFAPVDNASLVIYRIAFGCLALWEVWRFVERDAIARFFIYPHFHFTYLGFGWVKPWPGDGMHWHFAVLAVLAACIALGLLYRIATALFCAGFTYVFLLEKAAYLNHHYLFILLAFLLIFLPLNTDRSLDAWLRPGIRRRTAPAWALWALRAQMGLVYIYAGVAKLSGDWLRGQPLRIWLPERSDFPMLGGFFDEPWCALLFSYAGLAFDLLVVPLMLWRRTRPFAFGAALLFHGVNAQLFGIGIFPWLSIATTALFFPPDWPRRVLRWRRARPAQLAQPLAVGGQRRVVLAALALFFAVQVLVPLRHFLYPGNVSWTEEGHNFSWHMLLRDKRATARFWAYVPSQDEEFQVYPEQCLTARQYRKMSTRPHMLQQFARHLAGDLSRELGEGVELRADVVATLNGRPHQRLIDPTVDLAGESRDLWPKRWILALEADAGD